MNVWLVAIRKTNYEKDVEMNALLALVFTVYFFLNNPYFLVFLFFLDEFFYENITKEYHERFCY